MVEIILKVLLKDWYKKKKKLEIELNVYELNSKNKKLKSLFDNYMF